MQAGQLGAVAARHGGRVGCGWLALDVCGAVGCRVVVVVVVVFAGVVGIIAGAQRRYLDGRDGVCAELRFEEEEEARETLCWWLSGVWVSGGWGGGGAVCVGVGVGV